MKVELSKQTVITVAAPWEVQEWPGGVIAIQNADFKYGAALELSGDFASRAEELAYAETIAKILNAALGNPEGVAGRSK